MQKPDYWVKLEKQKPANMQTVFAYELHTVQGAARFSATNCVPTLYKDGEFLCELKVTHWLPRPLLSEAAAVVSDKLKTELLSRINKIGFAVSLMGKTSTGEAGLNEGEFAIDDNEVYTAMSHLALAEIEALVELLDKPPQNLPALLCLP